MEKVGMNDQERRGGRLDVEIFNKMQKKALTSCSSFIFTTPVALENEDILLEIFSWLPTRDLHRIKCVCKKWRSITSSPVFIEAHSRRLRTKHEPCLGLLIATADDKAQELVFYYSAMYEQQQHHQNQLLPCGSVPRSLVAQESTIPMHTQRQPLYVPHVFVPRSLVVPISPLRVHKDNHDHPPRVFVPRLRFPYSEYRWMTQVVNGLVCLYSTTRLSLLNICTRELLDLPSAPPPRPDYHTAPTALYRDGLTIDRVRVRYQGPPSPRRMNATNCTATHYHLGYDDVHKVYKVLCLSYMCTKDCTGPGDMCQRPAIITAQILTLSGPDISSFAWREVPLPTPLCKSQTQSFYVKGVLYFMHREIQADGCLRNSPFSFHVVHEYFCRPMSCPELMSNYEYFPLKISVFRECLAFVDCFSSSRRRVYVYSYTNREWEHYWDKDAFDPPKALMANSQIGGITPIGNLPNGDVLLANDRANKSFTPVCSYSYDTKSFKYFEVGKFPPSVASMSLMEVAVRISCLDENLTPLRCRLGTSTVISE